MTASLWLPDALSELSDANITNDNLGFSLTIDKSFVDIDGDTKIKVIVKNLDSAPIKDVSIQTNLACMRATYGVEKIVFV